MKKEMLKKMQMPKKPMAEDEAEMDLNMELGMEEEPDMPAPEEEMPEEMAEGEISPLADLGDEEIINELKARGLNIDDIKKMMKGSDEPEEEMPEEDEMMV